MNKNSLNNNEINIHTNLLYSIIFKLLKNDIL